MITIIRYIPTIYKAIVAGVLAGSGSFGALQVDGMTAGEWGYVVVVALVAGVGTWAKRNAGSTTQHASVEGPHPV